MGEPAVCSSRYRPSLRATTPCLLTPYGTAPGSAVRPAIDAVLTMCPSPCSVMIGRNARTPWITPYRLIPSTQSHSVSGPVHALPLPATPALLHSTWAAPKRSSVRRARSSTCSACEASQWTARTSPRARCELGFDRRQLGVVDVGEHDVHPLGREPLGERPTDPAARAGDDSDLARQRVHAGAPRRRPGIAVGGDGRGRRACRRGRAPGTDRARRRRCRAAPPAPGDLDALHAAIEESRDHLRPFMPWADQTRADTATFLDGAVDAVGRRGPTSATSSSTPPTVTCSAVAGSTGGRA